MFMVFLKFKIRDRMFMVSLCCLIYEEQINGLHESIKQSKGRRRRGERPILSVLAPKKREESNYTTILT